MTSATAILSLALAIGACTSVFRLIDALLLRPLPVATPERLYVLFHEGTGWGGKPEKGDWWEYPLFRQMQTAVKDQAELVAISYARQEDLTYRSEQETEKACVQYVSGWMFDSFELRPVLGRLLNENDDLKPGAHPYAVLSYDYWTHRFGQDPNVIGRTFRLVNDLYVIVGVAEESFTGTEPGTVTDIFVPTMMNQWVNKSNVSWIRIFVYPKRGVAVAPLGDRLRAIYRVFQEERGKGLTGISKKRFERIVNQMVVLEPVAAGISNFQRDNRSALAALSVLVALVLLIACANVANLMTAQAMAREREMAIRSSIGGRRWRLVQLVLVESAWLALLAAAIGALFAWWSAPFVVARINPPDNPARLALGLDWHVLAFGLALTVSVTFLFGLLPALRASAAKPANVLKGGEDPRSRRRMTNTLIATQVAFCFVVLFVGSLFVATFERLSHQPIGFSTDRLLTLDVVSPTPQPPAFWDQVTQHLRLVPGVEEVALAGWPLLWGYTSTSDISVDGAPPNGVQTFFLNVSPGWIDTMKIPWINGRDFRASDTSPGVAIVNEAFAKAYLAGWSPIGKWFEKTNGGTRYQIVGWVRNAHYASIRESILPVAYVPFQALDVKGAFQATGRGTFVVRTSSSNPAALATILRREVPRARAEFRVSNIRTQLEINQRHTVRERLLAMLALFFAGLVLLLAGIGLYGVLDYSVLQQRREIGIRIAVGAQASDIAKLVARDVFCMLLIGALAGLALGMASVRYIESLLYGVKATELPMLALPSLTILTSALLAVLRPLIRAVRIDPAATLRAE